MENITPIDRVAVTNLLNRAHCALRNIDAADFTAPIPIKWLDEISDAIAAIEEFCRARDIQLSDFMSLSQNMKDGR